MPNAHDKSWLETWDYENLLIKSEQTKGAEKRTVTFQYDPLGRRTQKQMTVTANGSSQTSTWIYVYDDNKIALEVYTAPSGATEKTWYTHGAGVDEHLALERSGNYFYYHADGLGSITAISDANKNIVQSYAYDSFGKSSATSNFRNSYAFTGREWDKETGRYYYRARYYDPMEGRFISKDPIGFDGGDVNLYGYVQNNPINWVDPSGLSPEKSFLQEYIDKIKKENDSIDWSKAKFQNCEISGFSKSMLSSSEIIAKGRNIRKIEELIEKFGGKAKDWLKKKGWDDLGNEWHWYENQGRKIGLKRPGEVDPF